MVPTKYRNTSSFVPATLFYLHGFPGNLDYLNDRAKLAVTNTCTVIGIHHIVLHLKRVFRSDRGNCAACFQFHQQAEDYQTTYPIGFAGDRVRARQCVRQVAINRSIAAVGACCGTLRDSVTVTC